MPTYTYDDALGSDRDRIRWQLGDSDMTAPLFSDEHITAVLGLRVTVGATVAALAGELVARYGREPVRVRTSDGFMVDYSDRLPMWRSLMTSASSGGGVASGTLTYPTFHPTPTADSITRGWRPE